LEGGGEKVKKGRKGPEGGAHSAEYLQKVWHKRGRKSMGEDV